MNEFNFKKQYIIQQLHHAASFLRLSKEQETVLYFLCNYLDTSNDVLNDLKQMVKITEISALALKIKHSYEYISSSKIQYVSISEIFKKQTKEMLHDLLNFLTNVDIKKLQSILQPGLDIDENNQETTTDVEEVKIQSDITADQTKENPNYKKFEKKIIDHIRYYDNLLTQLYQNSFDLNELADAVRNSKKLEEEIKEFGFEVIYDVHCIFSKALELLFKGTIPTTNDMIESMRSCLIVIASIVRSKDIDLSFYLSRIENLKKLLNSFHIL